MKSLVMPLPWRKDTTPNDTWVVFGVRSAVASLGNGAMMRRRLDSARQGFQRLRARLFERRHAAGEKAPRDAFGHVRDAGTLDIDAVLIPNLFDLDAETAQLHKHGSNDCVHVLSSKGAGTDSTA